MGLDREPESLDYVGDFLTDYSSLISTLHFPKGSTNAPALPVSLGLSLAAGIMDDSKKNMTLCVYLSISLYRHEKNLNLFNN